MKIIMRIIRAILSPLVLLYEAVVPVKKIPVRNLSEQVKIDAQTKELQLFQFNACPFCVKVRREMKALRLYGIQLIDVQNDTKAEQLLIAGGGQRQVPCLRIVESTLDGATHVRWLYESDDIIRYLRQRFAPEQVNAQVFTSPAS